MGENPTNLRGRSFGFLGPAQCSSGRCGEGLLQYTPLLLPCDPYQCNGLQPEQNFCIDCGVCSPTPIGQSCDLVYPTETQCTGDFTGVEQRSATCTSDGTTAPVCGQTAWSVVQTCTNGTCVDGACVVLAVVTSFSATHGPKGNTLRFATGAERDNLGFNVYRVTERGERIGKVNDRLIPGAVTTLVGEEYSWFDPAGRPGDWYVLEWIDTSLRIERSEPMQATRGLTRAAASRHLEHQHLRARSDAIRKDLESTRRRYDVAAMIRRFNQRHGDPVASGPILRISVSTDALCRVTARELAASGLDVSGLEQGLLSLTSCGNPVPFRVSSSPLDPSGFIEFYGQGNDSPQTGVTVYFLEPAPGASSRLRELPSRPLPGRAFGASYEESLVVERNVIYQWGTNLDDPFYWQWLMPGSALFETTFRVDEIADGSGFRLSGSIDGVTDNPAVDPDHHAQVFLNDALIQDAVWDGRTLLTLDEELPLSLLVEGENTLRVELVSDTGSPYDLCAVDGFEVRYPRRFVARDGSLQFSYAGTEPNLAVSGFSKPEVDVYDITRPELPIRLTGLDVEQTGETYSVGFARTARRGGSYVATLAENRSSPLGIERRLWSDLLSKTHGADLLIISHEAFVPALGPLVELRRSQGYRVVVATTGQVYDLFSHGHVTDQAIKDFIAYAAASWRPPALRSVLLVGDASNDPRDELGTKIPNFVPSHPVASQSWSGVSSDNWYADLPGKQRYDLDIGRLPVQTLAEATASIAKIVAYDGSAATTNGRDRVIVIADQSKPASPERFEAIAQAVLDEVPASYDKVAVFFRDHATAQQAGAAVLEALNQGGLLAIYIGHGSGLSWGTRAEFATKMIPKLAPGVHPPLVVSLSCVTGYLGYPGLRLMSEALVDPSDRGAVAAWSTSDAGSPLVYETLARSFVRRLFASAEAPVGDAVRAALNEIASDGDRERIQAADTFIYFGDPTQKLHLQMAAMRAAKDIGGQGGSADGDEGVLGGQWQGCSVGAVGGKSSTVPLWLLATLGLGLSARRRADRR